MQPNWLIETCILCEEAGELLAAIEDQGFGLQARESFPPYIEPEEYLNLIVQHVI